MTVFSHICLSSQTTFSVQLGKQFLRLLTPYILIKFYNFAEKANIIIEQSLTEEHI